MQRGVIFTWQEGDKVPLQHGLEEGVDVAVLIMAHAGQQVLDELNLVLLAPSLKLAQTQVALRQVVSREFSFLQIVAQHSHRILQSKQFECLEINNQAGKFQYKESCRGSTRGNKLITSCRRTCVIWSLIATFYLTPNLHAFLIISQSRTIRFFFLLFSYRKHRIQKDVSPNT